MAKRKVSSICIDLTDDQEDRNEHQDANGLFLLPRQLVRPREDHPITGRGDFDDIFRPEEIFGSQEAERLNNGMQGENDNEAQQLNDGTWSSPDLADETLDALSMLSDFSEISDHDSTTLPRQENRKDDNSNDDEVQVVDASEIQNSAALQYYDNSKEHNKVNEDDEVRVVATKNQVRLPHMRQDCPDCTFLTRKPGVDRQNVKTANVLYCDLCYCYVCDVPVKDCPEWNVHCHASAKSEYWKGLRLSVRQQRNGEKRCSPYKALAHVSLPPPPPQRQGQPIQLRRRRTREEERMLTWLASLSAPDTTCPTCGMYRSSCHCTVFENVVFQHCIHCRGMQGDCACKFGCPTLMNSECSAAKRQCPYCGARREDGCTCPIAANCQIGQQTTYSRDESSMMIPPPPVTIVEKGNGQNIQEPVTVGAMASLAAYASAVQEGAVSHPSSSIDS